MVVKKKNETVVVKAKIIDKSYINKLSQKVVKTTNFIKTYYEVVELVKNACKANGSWNYVVTDESVFTNCPLELFKRFVSDFDENVNVFNNGFIIKKY